MAGWIKVYRNIQTNWLWELKPFSRGQAWIDLLLLVNHTDNKMMFNGELIEVKRGSRITSIRQLSEKWGWSSTKVKKFLEQLKSDNMLNYKSDNKKTLLTIENYSVYQDMNDTEVTQKSHRSNSEVTQKNIKNDTEKYQKNTNKNDKEYIKNDKEGEERKEGKEIQPNSLPPLSFPSQVYRDIYSIVKDVGYRTWFMEADITSDDEKIVIKAEDTLKAGIIKSRYVDRLSWQLKKKIEVV